MAEAKRKPQGFFRNVPPIEPYDRVKLREEARKHKRPCECPHCQGGN